MIFQSFRKLPFSPVVLGFKKKFFHCGGIWVTSAHHLTAEIYRRRLILKKKQTLRSNAKSSRGWWLRLCWLMDTGAREPATLQRKQSKQPLCRPRLLWKRRAAIFEGSLNINSHALRTDRNLRPLKFNGCVLKFKYVTSLRPYLTQRYGTYLRIC